MKKILLSLTTLICLSAAAQTSKGNYLLGGGIGFSSITNKFSGGGTSVSSDPTTVFQFSPNAGYFVADNLAIGALLSFASANDKEEDTKASEFVFAPFVRYYFLKLGANAKLMGQGSFGFGSDKEDNESVSNTTWSLGAGPAIFLNSKTALEFTLNYRSKGIKESGARFSTNTFGVNVGLQIHLGK